MDETDPTCIALFWAKVDSGSPDVCWPWRGALTRTGYGALKWNGVWKQAHRVSHLLECGPILRHQVVRHLCGNSWCVNPSHLRAGTHQENAADARAHKAARGSNPKPPPPAPKTWLGGKPASPLRERLLRNIVKDDAGCWLWQGAKAKYGHGMIAVDKKPRLVHRVAYDLLVGPIPATHFIRHTCPNRHCINPDHLCVTDHLRGA
jgi:hypothetical protein